MQVRRFWNTNQRYETGVYSNKRYIVFMIHRWKCWENMTLRRSGLLMKIKQLYLLDMPRYKFCIDNVVLDTFICLLQNNGLQHLPTIPTKGFMDRMQRLFNAYLQPRMYYERNLGITNNPEKIAKYLSSADSIEEEQRFTILSYQDKRVQNYYHFLPLCDTRWSNAQMQRVNDQTQNWNAWNMWYLQSCISVSTRLTLIGVLKLSCANTKLKVCDTCQLSVVNLGQLCILVLSFITIARARTNSSTARWQLTTYNLLTTAIAVLLLCIHKSLCRWNV